MNGQAYGFEGLLPRLLVPDLGIHLTVAFTPTSIYPNATTHIEDSLAPYQRRLQGRSRAKDRILVSGVRAIITNMMELSNLWGSYSIGFRA